ncbi:hypothetical protein [Nonomuraea angiospora]
MTDQHTTTPVDTSKGATVTVTLRDGTQVTTSTWSTCVGVGRFVTDLLGAPAARHTTTLKEPTCP